MLNHRRLVVVSGAYDWCLAQCETLPTQNTTWIGAAPDGFDPIPTSKAKSLLGRESQYLVFNCFSGFNPDAFGAASGTLVGGGIMLLLCPPLADWPRFPDPEYQRFISFQDELEAVNGRFLKRLARLIRCSTLITLVEQGKVKSELPALENQAAHHFFHVNHCKSQSQKDAVDAIIKTRSGHRRRPLVISADRGRGKTAALGIAAATLMAEKKCAILITAPRPGATRSAFLLASQLLAEPEKNHALITTKGSSLSFIAPDRLIQQQPAADLVLVDEAAAIPTPMLEKILARYSRVVFSTTLHGYEGSGRGFALKFQQHLSKQSPNWRAIHLDEPIRWAANDPLEDFTFSALALDAEPELDIRPEQILLNRLSCEPVNRDDLVNNQQLLNQVFGLLVLAHYQTSPADLRSLLDNPNVQVFVVKTANTIIATALIVSEGRFSEALSEQIWLGKRRVKGHLLPQSLATHAGFLEAPVASYGRIMRIAVHPKLHNLGIGQFMLRKLALNYQEQGFDYIGTSFGATPELLSFWHKANYQTTRVGLALDAASGTHSLLALHPLSPKANQTLVKMTSRFHQQLADLLTGPLRWLDPLLVASLLNESRAKAQLDNQDKLDLQAYYQANRQFDCVQPCLKKLLLGDIQLAKLSKQQISLLIQKILQQHLWSQLVENHHLSGKKDAQNRVKEAIRQLLPADFLH